MWASGLLPTLVVLFALIALRRLRLAVALIVFHLPHASAHLAGLANELIAEYPLQRLDPRGRIWRASSRRVVFFDVNAELDYDFNLFSVSDKQLLASFPIDFVRCSSAPLLACPTAYTSQNTALSEGGVSSISAVSGSIVVN